MSSSSELARKLSMDAIISRLGELMQVSANTEIYERANDLLSRESFCSEFETTPDRAYRDPAMQIRAIYCAAYDKMLKECPRFML